MSTISQTSFLVGTFFAVSYSKLALVHDTFMITINLFFRSTHNMFAVALVNSDFKTAEPDYRNMEDTLISAGLDILSDVTILISYLYLFHIYVSIF